ncbi:MAG: hypothetical protein JRJ73_01745 [Deltaproteobacteria bacterium]|nr:hypothetical protein [Deltaproteobacteria bacterium]
MVTDEPPENVLTDVPWKKGRARARWKKANKTTCGLIRGPFHQVKKNP